MGAFLQANSKSNDHTDKVYGQLFDIMIEAMAIQANEMATYTI